MVKAILSTTVLPIDGTYTVTTLSDTPIMRDIPHYVGHPDTKKIIEELGAVQSDSKLFTGLKPGESAISCSIKQGMSNRVIDGFCMAHQTVTIDMLEFRLIARAEICGFCGREARIYPLWHCANCGTT